jgi:choice-of-anchor B domain-containing protein
MKRPLISRRVIGMFVVAGLAATALLAYQPVMAAVGGEKGQSTVSRDVKHSRFQADQKGSPGVPARTTPLSAVPCVDGFAGEYPCKNIDLAAFVPIGQIGGGSAADIWGWTDQLTGKEYALITRSSGVSFLDISNPVRPVYLGNLPTAAFSTSWRDVEVYKDHAFIVCDLCGNHGMQVFDLTRLRSVPNPPVTFTADAKYEGVDTVHTIAINTTTGFAYLVGSNTCFGGPHIVNIRDPLNPTQAGCYSADGYTHETQCVVYRGPDAEHRGREICFASNEDTLTILDVTNKSNVVMLSRTPYPGASYTHQGWLSGNHRVFVVDDELDEVYQGHNTRTRFFDVTDLESPFVRFIYNGPTRAIDHNQYIKGPLIYQANYQAGLRIISPPSTEVAYFDVYPQSNNPSFNGSWGNYPFFASGIVIVSHIEDGLFVLRPTIDASDYSSAWMR